MNKVFVIAEAGVNHNGDINIAKKLVDVAVEAKVDAVKFQTFRAESLVCKNAQKAEYQMETTDKKETQFDMLKKLELTLDMHKELIEYCKQKNVAFLSTPFDLESIDLLEQLGMEVYKIPSGEITNLPYLRKIGKLGKKVILSTGMSTIQEVQDAVKVLKDSGSEDISVLHCNTQYPTPMEDVNLNVMQTMREALKVPVGYSDHTQGIEVPIAATALGATVIEKHFTLDRNMEGPDHKASLEPEELKQMVQAIRNVEKALGKKEKTPTASEKDNIPIVRKSIVAKIPIKKGENFCESNITTKRPGTGLSPMLWDKVIGQKANRDFQADEMIEL
ncbi:N-acetylneuraminate synthase [Roseburia sp. MSJ-14]|uniref:N-acetylneuraminate synthase n=1 Tax=Roseburia sp. MSJ-14 TaxID=2841514 RepID=UPI001C109B8C|nr:N-acetylneuraminate synthase [Roseburia sp. MSJ-14]MBU5474783.1 N-acetylneuraminate synthase [Roseburia sp. MSJ-14]